MPYSRVVIESTGSGWTAEIDGPWPQQARLTAATPGDLCLALGTLLESLVASQKKSRAAIRPPPETVSPKIMPPVSRRSKARQRAIERAQSQQENPSHG